MSATPGFTDVHAHPAMNAFIWDRDLRRHYGTAGGAEWPLSSLTDFKMLAAGDVKVVWSALHVPEREILGTWAARLVGKLTRGGRMLTSKDAWQCLLAMMAAMDHQVARAGPALEVVRSNAELDRAVAAGRTAILHTVEGGHHLTAGLETLDTGARERAALERLELLAARGVASLTLAHLFPNALAGHVDAIPPRFWHKLVGGLDAHVDLDAPLHPFGARVVETMIELRMVPDVAHCTPRARRDVYALVRGRCPIVATHMGVIALNDVPYNLGREDVEAIAATGGLVGVIFMPYWLRADHPAEGADAIWETMRTIHDWTGSWDHVAVGTDFDGFTDPPDDLKSAAQLPAVTQRLRREGLDETDVAAVIGGNARRVLRAGWR